LKENTTELHSALKLKNSTAKPKRDLQKNLEFFMNDLDELDKLHNEVFNW